MKTINTLRKAKEFKEHLIEFRKECGLNKAQFSEEIGMSQSTITKIERGAHNPGYKFLKALNETYPQIDLLEWFGFSLGGETDESKGNKQS